MGSEVQPALTPEEWATLGPDGVGHPITPSTVGDIEALDAADCVKAMAVANHSLPDGHPQKLTWDDVDDCRSRAADFEALHDNDPDSGFYEAMRRWENRADRIASLLPPEGDMTPSGTVDGTRSP